MAIEQSTPTSSIDWDLACSHSAPAAAAEYSAMIERLRPLWPNLTPIERSPRLWSWKPGTGCTLLGRRGEDAETNTYVTSHVVTLVYVPVMILGSYRVRETPRGNVLFLGREPLSTRAWAWNAVVATVAFALAVTVLLQ